MSYKYFCVVYTFVVINGIHGNYFFILYNTISLCKIKCIYVCLSNCTYPLKVVYIAIVKCICVSQKRFLWFRTQNHCKVHVTTNTKKSSCQESLIIADERGFMPCETNLYNKNDIGIP